MNLDTVLGIGHSGVVYLGYVHDEPYAFKHSGSCIEEDDLLQRLDHPNIIQSFGVQTYANRLYMAMEYMKLGDLATHLPKLAKAFPTQLALQLARAVEYLHSKDLLHSDIAARNCLLSHTGETVTLKLADFGECVHNLQPKTGPRYALKWASPELLTAGILSKASDVWAFGITMSEMLFQEEPYQGLSRTEIEARIRDGLGPEIPDSGEDSIRGLILQCLHPQPTERISMKEVVRQLEALVQEENFLDCSAELLMESPNTAPAPPALAEYEENEDFFRYSPSGRASKHSFRRLPSLSEDF